MEFSYEQNGRKILCSYWSAPFSFEQFEKACEVFDEIQIWYPIEVNDRIYEKYGDVNCSRIFSNVYYWHDILANKWNLIGGE